MGIQNAQTLWRGIAKKQGGLSRDIICATKHYYYYYYYYCEQKASKMANPIETLISLKVNVGFIKLKGGEKYEKTRESSKIYFCYFN